MGEQYVNKKTSLTPGEKLRVAHAHLIDGVEQDVLARLFSVNIGRVNEAIQAVRQALGEDSAQDPLKF